MYTDVTAQAPAYLILTGVAVVAAVLLVANIWFRTLWLIGVAAGAWFVLSIVVGGVFPTLVQRFSVDPNELAVERPYLTRNIEATRAAFGLDGIEVQSFTGEQPLTRQPDRGERRHGLQPAAVGLPPAAWSPSTSSRPCASTTPSTTSTSTAIPSTASRAS